MGAYGESGGRAGLVFAWLVRNGLVEGSLRGRFEGRFFGVGAFGKRQRFERPDDRLPRCAEVAEAAGSLALGDRRGWLGRRLSPAQNHYYLAVLVAAHTLQVMGNVDILAKLTGPPCRRYLSGCVCRHIALAEQSNSCSALFTGVVAALTISESLECPSIGAYGIAARGFPWPIILPHGIWFPPLSLVARCPRNTVVSAVGRACDLVGARGQIGPPELYLFRSKRPIRRHIHPVLPTQAMPQSFAGDRPCPRQARGLHM